MSIHIDVSDKIAKYLVNKFLWGVNEKVFYIGKSRYKLSTMHTKSTGILMLSLGALYVFDTHPIKKPTLKYHIGLFRCRKIELKNKNLILTVPIMQFDDKFDPNDYSNAPLPIPGLTLSSIDDPDFVDSDDEEKISKKGKKGKKNKKQKNKKKTKNSKEKTKNVDVDSNNEEEQENDAKNKKNSKQKKKSKTSGENEEEKTKNKRKKSKKTDEDEEKTDEDDEKTDEDEDKTDEEDDGEGEKTDDEDLEGEEDKKTKNKKDKGKKGKKTTNEDEEDKKAKNKKDKGKKGKKTGDEDEENKKIDDEDGEKTKDEEDTKTKSKKDKGKKKSDAKKEEDKKAKNKKEKGKKGKKTDDEHEDDAKIEGEEADEIKIEGEEAGDVKIEGEEADDVKIKGEEADEIKIEGDDADEIKIEGEEADDVKIEGEEAGDAEEDKDKGEEAKDKKKKGKHDKNKKEKNNKRKKSKNKEEHGLDDEGSAGEKPLPEPPRVEDIKEEAAPVDDDEENPEDKKKKGKQENNKKSKKTKKDEDHEVEISDDEKPLPEPPRVESITEKSAPGDDEEEKLEDEENPDDKKKKRKHDKHKKHKKSDKKDDDEPEKPEDEGLESDKKGDDEPIVDDLGEMKIEGDKDEEESEPKPKSKPSNKKSKKSKKKKTEDEIIDDDEEKKPEDDKIANEEEKDDDDDEKKTEDEKTDEDDEKTDDGEGEKTDDEEDSEDEKIDNHLEEKDSESDSIDDDKNNNKTVTKTKSASTATKVKEIVIKIESTQYSKFLFKTICKIFQSILFNVTNSIKPKFKTNDQRIEIVINKRPKNSLQNRAICISHFCFTRGDQLECADYFEEKWSGQPLLVLGPSFHPGGYGVPFGCSIGLETAIKAVVFKRAHFEYFSAFLSSLLISSQNVKTIGFTEYPRGKEIRLKFTNVKKTTVRSWILLNCSSSMIKSFAKATDDLPNPIQSLKIGRYSYNKDDADEVFHTISNQKNLKRMLQLSFTTLNFKEFPKKSFNTLCSSLVNLEELEISRINIDGSVIFQAVCSDAKNVRQLVLNGLRFEQSWSLKDKLNLPAGLILLDLSESYFKDTTLADLFQNVTYKVSKLPFFFVLRSIQCTETVYPSFETDDFDMKLCQPNILELDMSGNSFPSNSFEPVFQFISTQNRIRNLIFTDIFVDRQRYFVHKLSSVKGCDFLTGIDFSGNFHPVIVQQFISSVSTMLGLKRLSVKNSGASNIGFSLIENLLNMVKGLREIEIDGFHPEDDYDPKKIHPLFLCWDKIRNSKSLLANDIPIKDLADLGFRVKKIYKDENGLEIDEDSEDGSENSENDYVKDEDMKNNNFSYKFDERLNSEDQKMFQQLIQPYRSLPSTMEERLGYLYLCIKNGDVDEIKRAISPEIFQILHKNLKPIENNEDQNKTKNVTFDLNQLKNAINQQKDRSELVSTISALSKTVKLEKNIKSAELLDDQEIDEDQQVNDSDVLDIDDLLSDKIDVNFDDISTSSNFSDFLNEGKKEKDEDLPNVEPTPVIALADTDELATTKKDDDDEINVPVEDDILESGLLTKEIKNDKIEDDDDDDDDFSDFLNQNMSTTIYQTSKKNVPKDESDDLLLKFLDENDDDSDFQVKEKGGNYLISQTLNNTSYIPSKGIEEDNELFERLNKTVVIPKKKSKNKKDNRKLKKKNDVDVSIKKNKKKGRDDDDDLVESDSEIDLNYKKNKKKSIDDNKKHSKGQKKSDDFDDDRKHGKSKKKSEVDDDDIKHNRNKKKSDDFDDDDKKHSKGKKKSDDFDDDRKHGKSKKKSEVDDDRKHNKSKKKSDDFDDDRKHSPSKKKSEVDNYDKKHDKNKKKSDDFDDDDRKHGKSKKKSEADNDDRKHNKSKKKSDDFDDDDRKRSPSKKKSEVDNYDKKHDKNKKKSEADDTPFFNKNETDDEFGDIEDADSLVIFDDSSEESPRIHKKVNKIDDKHKSDKKDRKSKADDEKEDKKNRDKNDKNKNQKKTIKDDQNKKKSKNDSKSNKNKKQDKENSLNDDDEDEIRESVKKDFRKKGNTHIAHHDEDDGFSNGESDSFPMPKKRSSPATIRDDDGFSNGESDSFPMPKKRSSPTTIRDDDDGFNQGESDSGIGILAAKTKKSINDEDDGFSDGVLEIKNQKNKSKSGNNNKKTRGKNNDNKKSSNAKARSKKRH